MVYYDYKEAIAGNLVPFNNLKGYMKVASSMNVEELALTEDIEGQTINIYEWFNFTA
jgi:hypothetical protein